MDFNHFAAVNKLAGFLRKHDKGMIVGRECFSSDCFGVGTGVATAAIHTRILCHRPKVLQGNTTLVNNGDNITINHTLIN